MATGYSSQAAKQECQAHVLCNTWHFEADVLTWSLLHKGLLEMTKKF